MDGEEESQGSNGLLSSRQVGHGLEALARGNAIVADALKVRLFGIFGTEECLYRKRD